MRKESINLGGTWLKRVNKTVARKAFNNGNSVWLLASKMTVCNYCVSPYEIDYDMDTNGFENTVNAYLYYNCNSETGTYVKFYIRDIARMKQEGIIL